MKMKTAPMGWNSWDCYGAAVTEDIVRRNAEFMAEHLKEYGWEYIVVDIQWYEPYAATNEQVPSFPVRLHLVEIQNHNPLVLLQKCCSLYHRSGGILFFEINFITAQF